jgi:hypothetical protein
MEEVCRVNLMHHGGSGTTCHNRISTQHICSEFFQFPAYRHDTAPSSSSSTLLPPCPCLRHLAAPTRWVVPLQ